MSTHRCIVSAGKLLIPLFVAIFQTTLFSATITSAGNGDFNDPGTWVGGTLPSATDSVVIDSDHSVDVTADDTVGSLTVYSVFDGDFTVLDIQAGITLTINNDLTLFSDGADEFEEPECQVRLRGTLVVHGDINFNTVTDADPSFATLKLTYANGYLDLKGGINFTGEGGVIDARGVVETTFKLSGTSAQTFTINSEIEYHHVIFANTSPTGVTLGGDINSTNVFGNITIESGKLDNNGYNIVGDNTKEFTIKSGTNFIMSGTTSMPSNYDHVIESGSTIEYAGSSQSVSGPTNSENYEDLMIKGTGTKTLAADIVINGDLDIQSGTLDANDLANYDIEIKGDWINSGGAFLAREGTVSFTGTSQEITGTTYVSGPLYVTTGTTLNTNGNLVIRSGASLMHGTGTPGGGGSIVGDVTVQRSGITGTSYNFWSSPVAAMDITSINNNNILHYYFNPSNATDLAELGNGWSAYLGTMQAGVGYAIANAGTISFTDEPNNAPTGTPITVDIKKNVGTSNDIGFNLVGNPFPSAMDADAFMAVNGPDGDNIITGSLYFWDDDGSNGGGWNYSDYAVWTGAGSISGPNSGTDFDGYIATGQGFFVEKINDGTDQIEFRNSMRSVTNDAFFRQRQLDRLWLSLTNDNNSYYNETLIAFIDDATDSVDLVYDARKLMGDPNIALYSKINTENYAIQAVSPLISDKTITVGLDVLNSDNYTIALKQIEGLEESVPVILEDMVLGTVVNLRKDSIYTFYQQGPASISRFKVHFSPPVKIIPADETCNGNDAEIMLMETGGYQWNYSLYNPDGLLADSGALSNGSTVIISDLVHGQYTVILTDSFGYQIEKLVLLNAMDQVYAAFEVENDEVFISQGQVFSNFSTGATDYEWDFGDGNIINGVENPTYSYSEPGIYQIMLTASSDDCEDHFTKQLTVVNSATNIGWYSEPVPKLYTTNGIAYAVLPNKAQIFAYNLSGQLLLEGQFTNGVHQLELPNNANIYLIEVRRPSGSFIQKLVVTR